MTALLAVFQYLFDETKQINAQFSNHQHKGMLRYWVGLPSAMPAANSVRVESRMTRNKGPEWQTQPEQQPQQSAQQQPQPSQLSERAGKSCMLEHATCTVQPLPMGGVSEAERPCHCLSNPKTPWQPPGHTVPRPATNSAAAAPCLMPEWRQLQIYCLSVMQPQHISPEQGNLLPQIPKEPAAWHSHELLAGLPQYKRHDASASSSCQSSSTATGLSLALGSALVLHIDGGRDVSHPGCKAVLQLRAAASRNHADVL